MKERITFFKYTFHVSYNARVKFSCEFSPLINFSPVPIFKRKQTTVTSNKSPRTQICIHFLAKRTKNPFPLIQPEIVNPPGNIFFSMI